MVETANKVLTDNNKASKVEIVEQPDEAARKSFPAIWLLLPVVLAAAATTFVIVRSLRSRKRSRKLRFRRR